MILDIYPTFVHSAQGQVHLCGSQNKVFVLIGRSSFRQNVKNVITLYAYVIVLTTPPYNTLSSE